MAFPHSLPGPSSDEQYIELAFLVRGGMGAVLYTSKDTLSNKEVVVKVLPVMNEEEEKLLEQEFKIAVSLVHPNIIQTYHYGRFEDLSGLHFFSIMEYCPAGNLANVISEGIRPIHVVIDDFRQLLNGLQYAHEFIIHRDLKPHNILIGSDGKLKICDFGIARFVEEKTRTKTFKGWGTYPYMSPECWKYDKNTRQMDIYSLGIIFYEMLTGEYPFKGPNESDFQTQHLFDQIPSLRSFRNDVPVYLAELVRKMTDKAINTRFKSVSEIDEILGNQENTQKEKVIDVNAILNAVHDLNQRQATAKAAKERLEDEVRLKDNLLSAAIDRLFQEFYTVVDALNEQLVDKQFHIGAPKRPGMKAFNKELRINFGEIGMILNFMSFDAQLYIKSKREAIIAEQNKKYGFVFDTSMKTYIELDRVSAIGKVYLTHKQQDRSLGFNVVLLHTDSDDMYGFWNVCKFEDALYRNSSLIEYCLNFEEFINEYEIGRSNAMHVRRMKFGKLSQSDIVELLSMMPRLQ